jgi:superfamily II DNA or RNA helicase
MALELRPHQVAAKNAVESELQIADRATVIMPCASGKTLVQLTVAGAYQRILILEPSLSLLRQTLQRAREEGITAGRTLLCICSDADVAKDAWRVDESELGVPVTTEAAKIRELLSGKDRVLAFCTYQSQPLLAAGLPSGFEFDLGIFEECHRTAGIVEKRFGAGLQDSHIPMRKRFFTTATPRVFAAEGSAEEARRAHSMDDVESYGRIVYQMSVRDAIESGIICDYQVLVSATTEAVAQAALEKAKETMLPQSQVPVDLVAAQLSVLKAIEIGGARRVITYHSTIAEAQEFVEDPLDLFRDAGVATFHIYGAMPSSQRAAVIEAFLAHDGPALISNARCLSEGVDVPAIDLVALMSKRESVVDVVQILGRALRPYPGKSTGYIMLPIFVGSEHPPEQSLSRSDLAITWEILHGILETDAAPTDFHLLGKGGAAGSTHSTAFGRGKLRVVAPDDLLAALERGITVRPVSRLGYDTAQMLEAARVFKEREGHLRVPVAHSEGPYNLGAWLKRMRKLRAVGRLEPFVEQSLNALGMDFGARSRTADDYIRELRDFHAQHGHWRIPRGAPWTSLWLFVKRARKQQREGQLDPHTEGQLLELKFPFDADLAQAAALEPIRKSIEAAGSLDTCWNQLSAGQKRWLRAKKVRKDEQRLSAEQLAAFTDANIDLDHLPVGRVSVLDRLAGEAAFARSMNALGDYLKQSGSKTVGTKGRHKGVHLGDFLKRCRREEARGELSVERAAALDAVGVEWRVGNLEASIRGHLKALGEFRAEFRHLKLPRSREYARLRGFVQSQRKNKSKLSESRLRDLESVGFTWNGEEDTWEAHLAALQRVRAEGKEIQSSSPLANYLRQLERTHRSSALDERKLKLLSELGISWARGEGIDIAMLARLTRIAKKFGKVNAASVARREADLAAWLEKQHKHILEGSIDPGLAAKLDKLGFRFARAAGGSKRTQTA